MFKTSIQAKLLLAVTGFVLLIELILAAFSYSSRIDQLQATRELVYRRTVEGSVSTAQDLLSDAEIVAQANSYMLRIGGMVLLIVLVVVGGTFWITRQLVVAPILRLIAHIRHNSRSGRLTPFPVDREDEIGFLISSYNELQQNQERYQGLRRSFVAMVAHDMRNPISGISGNLELAGFYLDRERPEDLRRSLDLARSQTARLVGMVHQFLDLNRSESSTLEMTLEPTDSGDLLEETALHFRPLAAGQGIRLDLALARPLPVLSMDREKIRRVLENLLGNALRHSPEGGRILLEGTQEKGRLVLRVADQGPGIPAEDLPQIFDRHFVGKGSLKGYGLGLAFCQLVVSGHQGEIRAENLPQGGALFTVEVPL